MARREKQQKVDEQATAPAEAQPAKPATERHAVPMVTHEPYERPECPHCKSVARRSRLIDNRTVGGRHVEYRKCKSCGGTYYARSK